MDRVCIYLRKSRADEELEKTLGIGETLSKHRRALLKYAKEKNLTILKIYPEVVSGESIIHRPEMLNLLKDVESGMYDAVLVMDMQRLGRGDMQDQGLILKTFKDSNTKIITPQKTYDLSNDFDEEYTEFEAFMSRKELKMINRRMQGGRIRSIEEGNYIATNPPYGYLIQELKRGRSLIPHPEQAPVIEMIFDMYVNKQMGGGSIADELNAMGFKTQTDKKWYSSAILNIIKNPIYIGKITWKKRDIKKSTDPNKKKDSKTRNKSEWIVANGKHEKLIDDELFYKAQDILSEKYHIPYQIVNGAKNPLAGLIICSNCQSKMVLRPYGNKAPHIVCNNKCGNKSSKFVYIESRLLESLKDWITNYEADIEIHHKKSNKSLLSLKKQLESMNKELKELHTQKLNVHDLLEKGIYNIDTFIERSRILSERETQINENINVINTKICNEEENSKNNDIIANVKKVLELYIKTKDPAKKNMLLKDVLEKVVYFKDKKNREDDFTLTIFPKHSTI